MAKRKRRHAKWRHTSKNDEEKILLFFAGILFGIGFIVAISNIAVSGFLLSAVALVLLFFEVHAPYKYHLRARR